MPVMSKFLPSINWVQLSVSKFSVYSDFSFSILQIFNKSCSDYGDNGCKGTSTELTIQPCVWCVPVANHNIYIYIYRLALYIVRLFTKIWGVSEHQVSHLASWEKFCVAHDYESLGSFYLSVQ